MITVLASTLLWVLVGTVIGVALALFIHAKCGDRWASIFSGPAIALFFSGSIVTIPLLHEFLYRKFLYRKGVRHET